MSVAPQSGLPGVQVELRARSAWQALDLGTVLLRQHARVLYGSWLLVTLPIVALIGVLPGGTFVWGVAVVFWLKPIFERLTVLCLARELFGEPVALGNLLKLFFRSVARQAFATLTWRRLSFTRAIDQPVTLLEAARGSVRRARLSVLHRTVAANAFWTMSVLFLVEATFVFSVMLSLMSLQPIPPESLQQFFEQWPHAFPAACFVAIWMVGPLHAAAGFALYINRRCELEAWDIEVGFRRLADRLRHGSAPLAVLALAVLLACASVTERGFAAPESEAPLEVIQKQTGAAPLHPLPRGPAAAQARRDIAKVLADKVFHVRGQRTYPAFLDDIDTTPDDPTPSQWHFGFFNALAEWAWWIFWACIAVLVLWIASAYARWARALRGLGGTGSAARRSPLVVAGIELHAAETQDDSLDTATQLWQSGHDRPAMAMLLRMSLTQLVAQGARFRSGDTEADCLLAVEASQSRSAVAFLRQLFDCWVPLAYGQRRPDESAIARLFADFANGQLQAQDQRGVADARAGT